MHLTHVLLGTDTGQFPCRIGTLLVLVGAQSKFQGRGKVGEGRPGTAYTHGQNHTANWSGRDSAMNGTLRGESRGERHKYN